MSPIAGKFPEGEIQPHGLTKNAPIGFSKRISEEEKRYIFMKNFILLIPNIFLIHAFESVN